MSELIRMVDKNTAFEAFKNGENVLIGYCTKISGSGFWGTDNLTDKITGNTKKQHFESMIKAVKNFVPNTRIKFALYKRRTDL